MVRSYIELYISVSYNCSLETDSGFGKKRNKNKNVTLAGVGH